MTDRSPGPITTVLIAGLAVMVVCFVAIMVVSEVVIPPLVILAVVFAALAAAVYRWPAKRWLLWVAGGITVVALLGNFPFILEDGAHPESFWNFVPTILSAVAAVVVIAAAAALLLRSKPTAARVIGVAGAAAGLLVIAVSTFATLAEGSDDASANDIRVEVSGNDFPENVTAPPGDVVFFVENKDRIRHTFSIEGQDVDVELPGGKSKRVTVNLTAGTYRLYCDVAGHEDMETILQVR